MDAILHGGSSSGPFRKNVSIPAYVDPDAGYLAPYSGPPNVVVPPALPPPIPVRLGSRPPQAAPFASVPTTAVPAPPNVLVPDPGAVAGSQSPACSCTSSKTRKARPVWWLILAASILWLI